MSSTHNRLIYLHFPFQLGLQGTVRYVETGNNVWESFYKIVNWFPYERSLSNGKKEMGAPNT